jgi:acetyl-CoA carboxylase alpha subunit
MSTGALLAHKKLTPNYALRGSIQQIQEREEQRLAKEQEELRKQKQEEQRLAREQEELWKQGDSNQNPGRPAVLQMVEDA